MVIKETLESNLIRTKNYIEIIKNNIIYAKEIKKIAIREKVDYKVAKIMYNNGKNNIDKFNAKKLLEISEKENIPLIIADDLNRMSISLNDKISLDDLYIKISNYINKDTINKLDEYIHSKYKYGKLIYDIIQSGYTLNQAVKMVDEEIKKEIKKTSMSELAVTAKLLCFETDIEAKEFEIAYNTNTAIKGEPEKTVKNRLFTSTKYKRIKINGITLISLTEEGLKELKIMVKNAYDNGNKQYLEKLSNSASKYDLFITDFSLIDDNVSHYYEGYTYIYMHSDNQTEQMELFYHETAHFLDNIKGREINNKIESYYSTLNKDIKSLLEEIKSKIMVVPKGLSLGHFSNIKASRYINDIELNKKWLKKIKESKKMTSEEDIKFYMQQKKLYERQKYLLLCSALADILDGLTKGKLRDFGQIGGHGMAYFSKEENILIEFMAEIGEIYNYNGIDFLKYELGEELTLQLIEMYKVLIDNNSNSISKKNKR